MVESLKPGFVGDTVYPAWPPVHLLLVAGSCCGSVGFPSAAARAASSDALFPQLVRLRVLLETPKAGDEGAEGRLRPKPAVEVEKSTAEVAERGAGWCTGLSSSI